MADSGEGPGGPGPPPPLIFPPYLKVWIGHYVGTVIDIMVVCKTLTRNLYTVDEKNRG